MIGVAPGGDNFSLNLLFEPMISMDTVAAALLLLLLIIEVCRKVEFIFLLDASGQIQNAFANYSADDYIITGLCDHVIGITDIIHLIIMLM